MMARSITHQFLNSDDVNMRLQHFRVFDLMANVEANNIQDERFYGLYDNWNPIRRSQYIESLIIQLPTPLLYFDGSKKPWEIIDGFQRINTLLLFIAGKFKLIGLEYIVLEGEGHSFQSLPDNIRKRILDAKILGYVINPGTPVSVKASISRRIRTNKSG